MSGDLPVGPAEGYLLAFEEGARGLARQEAQLDAMRSRAGILLSAAAIATSVLGGQALSDDGPEVWTWLAIASFIALAISALVILCRAASGPSRQARTDCQPLPRRRRTVAAAGDPSRARAAHGSGLRAQPVRLDHLIWAFRAASSLLVVEVGMWVVNLVVIT